MKPSSPVAPSTCWYSFLTSWEEGHVSWGHPYVLFISHWSFLFFVIIAPAGALAERISFSLTLIHNVRLSHSLESVSPSCRLSLISLIWLRSPGSVLKVPWALMILRHKGWLDPSTSSPNAEPGEEDHPQNLLPGIFRTLGETSPLTILSSPAEWENTLLGLGALPCLVEDKLS